MLVWAPKQWHPKNSFQVVFFICISTKKDVEVVINDFTIHLIILKWLRKQKCRQKRKTARQKDVKVKEEIAYENVLTCLNM